MAEVDFERNLERMFGDIGDLPDAADFARSVEQRLDRGWNARRLLIGAAGVVGGLVGASQLIMSDLPGRLESASAGSARLFSVTLAEVAPRLQWLATAPSGAVAWAAAALAVVAMGFVLSRVIEEI